MSLADTLVPDVYDTLKLPGASCEISIADFP